MKKIFLATIISGMLLAVAPTVLAANLVENGGFEEPVVTDSAQWDIFPDGTTGLGWTVEWRSDIPTYWPNPGNWDRPDPALQELHRGVNGWLPQEGDQYAELDTDWDGPGGGLNGEPASVKIYQDLPTGAGCQYDLIFYFSPRPGTPADDNVLEVMWDGTILETISRAGSSINDWSEYTYTVTASGATTRLEFTDLGTANSLGTFLDNVIVEEISCPCPPPKPGQVNVGNKAIVLNRVTAVSDTGGNKIVDVAKYGGRSNGNNTINTGDATAEAGTINVVNSNLNEGCCGRKQINVDNFAMVGNTVTATSSTGGNKIVDVAKYGGRNGGDNRINTGNATTEVGVINIVNSNINRSVVPAID